ncbi:MAG: TlpA family protein disulfide reductase, partial [Candidatus Kapabacteria bacterium]|nr:TlpA family protein disulfide reductase [Candidatus Kapabacteria bacterium]
ERILRESIKKSKSIRNVHFTAHYKLKTFNTNDTTKLTADIFAEKQQNSKKEIPVFAWKTDRSDAAVYNGKVLSEINDSTKTIIQYSNTDVITIRLHSTMEYGCLDYFVHHEKRLTKVLQDASTITQLPQQTVNNIPCFVIQCAFKDAKEFSVATSTYYIATTDYSFVKIVQRMKVEINDGGWQYSEITFTDVRNETIPPHIRTLSQWRSYTIKSQEDVLLESQNQTDSLIGTLAPQFTATGYDGNTYNLASLQGKTVFLYHWRLGCSPCEMVKGFLSELNLKYKSQNVVMLGVYDNERDSSQVRKYLTRNKLSFTTLQYNKELISQYKFDGTPNFVIIDKTGKVRYFMAGYGKHLNTEFESELKKAIDN